MSSARRPALRTSMLKLFTFTPHLIMGQVFYSILTHDPRDPFTFVDPFDP